MDEAALRAMLPMGFGKQTSKRRAPAPEPNQPSKPPTWESTPAPSAVASGSSLANRILAARKGKEPVRDEEFDDDGLTTAEREENARIAAQVEDSSDEDLGPEPEDPTLSLPISHEALLKDHSKVCSPQLILDLCTNASLGCLSTRCRSFGHASCDWQLRF